MLRESTRLIAYRRLFVDLLLTAGSFLLAHQLRSHLAPLILPGAFPRGLYPVSDYLPLLPVVLVVWGILLAAERLATPGAIISLRREVVRVLEVVGIGLLVVLAIGYLLRLSFLSRPFLLLFALTNAAFLVAARIAERRTRWGRALGEAPERVVVVVGCGQAAAEIASLIAAQRSWGFTVRGLVVVNGCDEEESGGFPVLGPVADLPQLVTREVVDEVVLAVPLRQIGELETAVLHCQELGVRVRVVLQPFAHVRPRIQVETLHAVPFLTFSTAPTAPLALFAKRVIDVVGSIVLLLASAPLWPFIAVAVRLSSPGPVFYRQTRCGLQGRRFTLLKFRTMEVGADRRQAELAHLNVVDGPAFKALNDPRVTRVGRLLRRFSLDELPQLLNVLKDDMSLVGPRPPLPDEVEAYQPWQRRRLAMKPGVTGLWQVSGRTELDFTSWVELDLSYIDHWSLWLDFKILAWTVPAVLGGRGAA